MAICHYMMVCPGCGGAGGSMSEMPSARRALGGSVAEVDFDNAHGFEGSEGLRCGEIKTSGLELLFDRAMEQERQRRDEDVRLHAIVGAVIDRPQVNDVLEIGERALDFGQLLVEPHSLDGGQIGLFGLDHVFAFVSLLADKVHGVLEEAEDAVLIRPAVIAMAVIAGEDSGGGGTDLLGEPPFGDSL